MTRRTKEIKEEKQKQEIRKVKDVIAELNLETDETVFIYKYGSKDYTAHYLVSELPDDILKQKVMTVNPKYGGVEYKYSAWQIIIK